MTPDPTQLDAVREALEAAADKDAGEALPHLREAADRLTALIDESMAEALLAGKVSLRSAGAAAGLTENAVPPRLARTQTLGAYANEDGRVTAAGVERAKYDHESGTPKPAPAPAAAARCGSSRAAPADQEHRPKETAMTRSDLTHLYFLLDRSGSMQSIKSDIEGGFAAFVDEQRKGAGECRATLAQFDDVYEVVYADRPIADVPPLDLQPRNMTALHDAMGRLITDAGAKLAALPEDQRPGTVIVAIMTDGLENASKEWTGASIKALVEPADQRLRLAFMYMGADQDAVEVGASLGVDTRPGGDLLARQVARGDGRGLGQDRQAARGPDRRPGRADGGVHRGGAGLAGASSDAGYFGGIRMPPSTRITSAFM